MPSKLNSVHIKQSAIPDLLEIGDSQLANPYSEYGAAIIGEIRSEVLDIHNFYNMGTGSNSGFNRFDINDELARKTNKKIKELGKKSFGIAHTHGPRILSAEPSIADLKMATEMSVSIIVKVNKDGGGELKIFNSEGNDIPFIIDGLDGKQYGTAVGKNITLEGLGRSNKNYNNNKASDDYYGDNYRKAA